MSDMHFLLWERVVWNTLGNMQIHAVFSLFCVPLRSVVRCKEACFKREGAASSAVKSGYSPRKWSLGTTFCTDLLGCFAKGSIHLHVLESSLSYDPTFKRNGNSKVRLKNLVHSIGSSEGKDLV